MFYLSLEYLHLGGQWLDAVYGGALDVKTLKEAIWGLEGIPTTPKTRLLGTVWAGD